MKILFFGGGTQSAAGWVPALRAALPGHEVEGWTPGLPPVYDLAAVWGPPQQLFDEQPQLRAVFNLGAGVDKLMSLRLPQHALVLRLEDVGMGVQMAEYVCHAVIRFYRQFDQYTMQQRAAQWQRLQPRARADFPVGVMGLGTLGTRVLQALRAFEFPLLGWSRTRHAMDGVHCLAGERELPDFLAATRILVCLLPLTPATRGMLNAERLGLLRPDAYLINVARGGLVVEEDLRAALSSGHVAGATLDVMAQEPLPPDHWLWSQPGVALTPHVSAQTLQSETIAALQQAVADLTAGKEPRGRVDQTRGY